MGMSCERKWMRGNGTIWPRSDYGPNRLVAPFLPFLLCLDARAHVEPSFLFNVLSFPPLVDLSPITPLPPPLALFLCNDFFISLT